ncbi:MFS transporter [Williamsia sp. 1135]|uniref:MFS transporter n=1 Tax=Williamsia sp. 1135 TaxID=1889262 RepID=UPI001F0A180E|nr:MFS transporter [Williamsia sp. 1135]
MGAEGGPAPDALSVQAYIDEVPTWHDGTPSLAGTQTRMQRRIWFLASAGKFFEGMIIFMVGVALPLIKLEFSLNANQTGLVTAAPLLGIMIGATALGNLSDRFGRRGLFVFEMVLLTIFLVGVSVSPGLPVLVGCLFGLGLALGCDYPTAHMMISETISTANRGRSVLSAFAFQAIGATAGTLIGVIILGNRDEVSDWRWMFAVAIIPAIVVTIGRTFVVQSPHWLLERGKVAQAQVHLARLLEREPKYPTSITLEATASDRAEGTAGWATLFRRPWRRSTILASVPWFLQDLGTYGIGIFTPTIVAATVGTVAADDGTVTSAIAGDLNGAEGAAVIDVLLLVGIALAIVSVNRFGRIKLQIVGFLGCAAGLAIAALSTAVGGTMQILLIFGGFMLFNLMTNLGPNSMTYLLAGEVFPTRLRGTGAGLAASFGKVGAVLTAFLFPLLLDSWGTMAVLTILVATSLLGAFVTWKFSVDTNGLSMAQLDQMYDEPPTPTSTSAPTRNDLAQPDADEASLV